VLSQSQAQAQAILMATDARPNNLEKLKIRSSLENNKTISTEKVSKD
jgi:hypothetical protein